MDSDVPRKPNLDDPVEYLSPPTYLKAPLSGPPRGQTTVSCVEIEISDGILQVQVRLTDVAARFEVLVRQSPAQPSNRRGDHG